MPNELSDLQIRILVHLRASYLRLKTFGGIPWERAIAQGVAWNPTGSIRPTSGSERAVLSRSLARLEQQGYICRSKDPATGRTRKVKFTQKGWEASTLLAANKSLS